MRLTLIRDDGTGQDRDMCRDHPARAAAMGGMHLTWYYSVRVGVGSMVIGRGRGAPLGESGEIGGVQSQALSTWITDGPGGWDLTGTIRVRVRVHRGLAVQVGLEYGVTVGPQISRAERITR